MSVSDHVASLNAQRREGTEPSPDQTTRGKSIDVVAEIERAFAVVTPVGWDDSTFTSSVTSSTC